MALRFDITKLDNTKRDHNGYLVADAHATRTGVFVYRHPDGTVTRELRHPDDVFRPDSINSLKNRPITDGHPISGKVNAKNTRSLSVGMAIDDPRQEGQYLDTNIQITDEAVINKVMSDDSPLRELSCGYEAEVIKEDGVFQGEEYDHRQTNIEYNHIALVKRGRAGSQVRLQLDSADAAVDGYEDIIKNDIEETEENIHIPVRESEKFKEDSLKTDSLKGIDGVNFVVGKLKKSTKGDEDLAVMHKFIFSKQHFNKDQAREFMAKHKKDEAELVKSGNINQTNDSKQSNSKEDNDMVKIKREAVIIRSFNMDSFQVEVDDSTASGEKAVEAVLSRLDAAIAHINKLEGDLDKKQGRIDAMSDMGKVTLSKLNDHVKERTDAVNAAHYLGLTNFMDMETEELKKSVVVKAYPAVKIDELTADHIEGRYDTIIEGIKSENKNLKSLQEINGAPINKHSKFPVKNDGVDPRTAFLNDTRDMYMDDEQRKLDS